MLGCRSDPQAALKDSSRQCPLEVPQKRRTLRQRSSGTTLVVSILLQGQKSFSIHLP